MADRNLCPFCHQPITNVWHVLDCPMKPVRTFEEKVALKANHDWRKIEYGDKFREEME